MAAKRMKAGEFTAEQRAKLVVEKQAKLKELASKRVGRVISAMRLVGNLGSYHPTEAQVKAILEALRASANDMASRLAGAVKTSTGFTLPE